MAKTQVLVIIGILAGFTPAQESLGVRLVGSCSAVGHPEDLVVQGDYAYIADGEGGAFRIVSVSDPAHPVQVGRCFTPGVSADGVAVSGDYAYVADFDQGLRVISISDPANPVEVGYYDTPGSASKVALKGDYAYVADGDSGLRIVSVADPANPVEVGQYAQRTRDVAIRGDYAYVAGSGLRVVSIADPANPIEVGYCPIPASSMSVAAESVFVYVAASDRGLRVVSVADPAHPVEVGYRDTPDLAWSVAVSGDSAYIADRNGGLRVISVADSAHPVEVGYYVRLGSSAHGVAVRGGCIYVGDGGLQVYQCYVPGVEEETEARVRAANPIPSVVRGVLCLSGLGGNGDSPSEREDARYSPHFPVMPRAVLLDVGGRKVLDLRPGANDMRALAPGVYFVHEAQAQAVLKVVIAR